MSAVDPVRMRALRAVQLAQWPEAAAALTDWCALTPDDAECWMLRGTVNAQLGDAEQALEQLQRAVALREDYAGAHFNLALVHQRRQDMAAAMASAEKAVTLDPTIGPAWQLLGHLRYNAGRLAESGAAFLAAAQCLPQPAEAWYCHGNVLRESGDINGAVASYGNALRHNPDHAPASNNLGSLLFDQGDYTRAETCYRTVLRSMGDGAPALHNYGTALLAQARWDEAIVAFERALAADPSHSGARHNFVLALHRSGRTPQALQLLAESGRHGPATPALLQTFADVAGAMAKIEAVPALKPMLLQAIETPGIEHQKLAGLAMACLGAEPAVASWLSNVEDVAKADADALQPLAEYGLLQGLLVHTVMAHPDWERLLTAVRRRMLFTVGDPDGHAARFPAFAAALACQCFSTDYVYAEAEDETSRVAALRQEIEREFAAGNIPVRASLAIMSAYLPLLQVSGIKALPQPAANDSVPWQILFRRQLTQPLQEADLGAKIPKLTVIEDATSQAVRRQYEEFPYPRWLDFSPPPPALLTRLLATLFPYLELPSVPATPKNILVAGCGTGRHAVATANRFPNSRVLAIDISRTSLAYAKRECRDRGLQNVELMQADLLELGSLEQRFELIESLGVLHHLRDPLAGWRALTALLRPGGIMNIGLYSRRARAPLAASQAFISKHKFGNDRDGIRAARQALLALPAGDEVRRVSEGAEFYNLNNCRDLLFHVQETSYTPLDIGVMLASLGLKLIGFEFQQAWIQALYRTRFPQDDTLTDFSLWDKFEQQEPFLFAPLCQFWCRKPD